MSFKQARPQKDSEPARTPRCYSDQPSAVKGASVRGDRDKPEKPTKQ